MADAFDIQYNGCCDVGRGVTHYLKVGGHSVQIYITKKRKKIRVFVDHKELV